jgi:hypothetical protein
MALFHPGETICPICKKPVMAESDFLAFTCVGTLPSVYSQLDDGVVHQSCLSQWDQRDDFIRHWNMAISQSVLDQNVHCLEIHGRVVKYKERISIDVEQQNEPRS